MSQSTTRERAAIVTLAAGHDHHERPGSVLRLASFVAAQGKRVCVLDADPDGRITRSHAESPRPALREVMEGRQTLERARLPLVDGLDLLPGCAWMSDAGTVGRQEAERLEAALSRLQDEYDVLVIDAGAGNRHSVLHFLGLADFRVVLCVPEKTSLAHGFRLLQRMRESGMDADAHLLVNRARSATQGRLACTRLVQVADRRLGRRLRFLGYVLDDDESRKEVPDPRADGPGRASGRCLRAAAAVLARRLQPLQPGDLAERQTATLSIEADEPSESFADLDAGTDPHALLDGLGGQALREVVERAVEMSVHDHGRLPLNPVTLLHRGLALGQVRDRDIPALVETLEARYLRDQGRPIRSLDAEVARLAALYRDAPQRLGQIHERLGQVLSVRADTGSPQQALPR